MNALKTNAGILTVVPILLALVVAAHQDASAAESDAAQGDNTSFAWYSLVEPLGISTLSCLLLTFLAGLFRRKLGRRFKKVHIALAAITVTLALSHGLLVLIVYG